MSKITIDREVLEKVLAALEKCDSALAEELAAWDIDPPIHHVLEASNACAPAIAILNAALAQPQQDPVARVRHEQIGAGHGTPAFTSFNVQWIGIDPMTWSGDLYTSPPARKPLTDEQWLSVGRQARDAFFGSKQDSVLSQIDCAAHAAMRATESAHGIKDTPC